MKFPRKRKLLAVAGIVILAMITIAWWAPAKSKAALTFVGFQEMNGERSALFSVRNVSANRMDYSSALIVPCDGPLNAASEPNLALEGCRFDIVTVPFRGTLQAGESALLSVPMAFDTENARAFQIMLPIQSARPKWLQTLGERLNPRLPNSLWKPQDLKIWSEVVMPQGPMTP